MVNEYPVESYTAHYIQKMPDGRWVPASCELPDLESALWTLLDAAMTYKIEPIALVSNDADELGERDFLDIEAIFFEWGFAVQGMCLDHHSPLCTCKDGG